MKRYTLSRTLRKRTGRAVHSALARAYAILVSPLAYLLASRARFADMLVGAVVKGVEEVDQNGQVRPLSPAKERLSILALSPQEFRHDLEVLAAHRELRILRLPQEWQKKLMRWFYGVWPSEAEVHNPAPGSGAARAQSFYRQFLRAFLPRLYSRLGVDVVIGANVRYPEDVDWGATSQQLGVPYVVFHRENLPVGPSRLLARMTDRYRSFGGFTGACMAVHNSFAANLFRTADYIAPDRIFELGCLRMDQFLRRLQQPRPARSRPMVLLFSFTSFSPSTFGKQGYFPPFRDSHGALACLAQKHPELDVVIRPKPNTFKHPRWNAELAQSYEHWGVDPNQPPANLSIDPDSDAHDLILNASVVVALNSTTLVEAAIAGLPVIMPNFRYLREGSYAGDILLRDYSDLFDVPDTGEDLIEMVLHRLRDPSIPEKIMQRRRRLFADAISPLDGKAAERYLQLLQRVAAREAGMERHLPMTETVVEPGVLGR